MLRSSSGRCHRAAVSYLRSNQWLRPPCQLLPSQARCPSRARSESADQDRKSTRLNSSHLVISYAVFCLKKKTSTCRSRSRTLWHASEERAGTMVYRGVRDLGFIALANATLDATAARSIAATHTSPQRRV